MNNEITKPIPTSNANQTSEPSPSEDSALDALEIWYASVAWNTQPPSEIHIQPRGNQLTRSPPPSAQGKRVEESLAQLKARLEMAERAFERSERLAVANRYAGSIMHEVNNPLEAITNLVYLTKSEKDNPARVLEYMAVIEEQLKILGRVTKQALTFDRVQSDASELDLQRSSYTATTSTGTKFRWSVDFADLRWSEHPEARYSR